MSKTETAQHLAQQKSSSIADKIKELRELQQTTLTGLRRELEQLPEAISQEIAPQIEVIQNLRHEVNTVLSHYDQVAKAQRATIEAVTAELTAQAAAQFTEQTRELQRTLDTVTGQLSGFNTLKNRSMETAQDIRTLSKTLQDQLQELEYLTKKNRSAVRKTAVITGIITALLTSACSVGLSYYLIVGWMKAAFKA